MLRKGIKQIEFSFNKIDTFLDLLLNDTSDSQIFFIKRQFQYYQLYTTLKHIKINLKFQTLRNHYNKTQYHKIKHNINNLHRFKDQSLNEEPNKQMNILDEHSKQEIIQLSYKSHEKPFNYQLIPEYSISQNDHCFTIAINQDVIQKLKYLNQSRKNKKNLTFM